MLTTICSLLGLLSCNCLYSAQAYLLGMGLPTVDWALPLQLSITTMPLKQVTGQSDQGNSSVEFFSSQVILGVSS